MHKVVFMLPYGLLFPGFTLRDNVRNSRGAGERIFKLIKTFKHVNSAISMSGEAILTERGELNLFAVCCHQT